MKFSCSVVPRILLMMLLPVLIVSFPDQIPIASAGCTQVGYTEIHFQYDPIGPDDLIARSYDCTPIPSKDTIIVSLSGFQGQGYKRITVAMITSDWKIASVGSFVNINRIVSGGVGQTSVTLETYVGGPRSFSASIVFNPATGYDIPDGTRTLAAQVTSYYYVGQNLTVWTQYKSAPIWAK